MDPDSCAPAVHLPVGCTSLGNYTGWWCSACAEETSSRASAQSAPAAGYLRAGVPLGGCNPKSAACLEAEAESRPSSGAISPGDGMAAHSQVLNGCVQGASRLRGGHCEKAQQRQPNTAKGFRQSTHSCSHQLGPRQAVLVRRGAAGAGIQPLCAQRIQSGCACHCSGFWISWTATVTLLMLLQACPMQTAAGASLSTTMKQVRL